MTKDGLKIRTAGDRDVGVISKILEAAKRAIDPQRDVSSSEVIKLYLSHPDQIALFIAELDGDAVGFQFLKRASVPNMYDVPKHWGVIGSYVVPKAMRKGIGSALWTETKCEVIHRGLTTIDATTLKTNHAAITYYTALGFVPCATEMSRIRLRYDCP